MNAPGKLEVIARHICAAEGLNPDTYVSGGFRPQWMTRRKAAQAVWDLFVDWGFQTYPDEET